MQANKNNTFILKVVNPEAEREEYLNNVPKSQLAMIQPYGVSVYNINNMPKSISHGQFEFSLDLAV